MQQVVLLSWQAGFVANRLIALLREHGLSLADAHALATRFTNGEQVTIQIPSDSAVEQFARRARSLNVQFELRRPAIAS